MSSRTTILLLLIAVAWTLSLTEHDAEVSFSHEVENAAGVNPHQNHPSNPKAIGDEIIETLLKSEDSFLEAIQLEQQALVHQTSLSRVLSFYNKIRIGAMFDSPNPALQKVLKAFESQLEKDQDKAEKFKKAANKAIKHGLDLQKKSEHLEKQLHKLLKNAHQQPAPGHKIAGHQPEKHHIEHPPKHAGNHPSKGKV